MKLKKYLFLALFVFLTVSVSQAQEKIAPAPVDVSISVKKTRVAFGAKSVMVELKITNNSPSAVDTKQFGVTRFTLSTNLNKESTEETVTAFFKPAPKVINAGESFVTEIDLNKLEWEDNSLRNISIGSRQRAYRPMSGQSSKADKESESRALLMGAYFLSVEFANCENFSTKNSLSTNEPEPLSPPGKGCRSNSVLMSFLTPAQSR